jgi:hypothetical protein
MLAQSKQSSIGRKHANLVTLLRGALKLKCKNHCAKFSRGESRIAAHPRSTKVLGMEFEGMEFDP